jgi:hypothetical protein
MSELKVLEPVFEEEAGKFLSKASSLIYQTRFGLWSDSGTCPPVQVIDSIIDAVQGMARWIVLAQRSCKLFPDGSRSEAEMVYFLYEYKSGWVTWEMIQEQVCIIQRENPNQALPEVELCRLSLWDKK